MIAPMRYSVCILAWVLVWLLALGQVVLAAHWYIRPSAEVPLRRGQGTEYKIIAIVPDATEVELLEEQDDWARIRLASGKEGWILKRYLSSDEPLAMQLAQARKENEDLTRQLEAVNQDLAALQETHGQAQQDLAACLSERESITEDLKELQKDADSIEAEKKQLAKLKRQQKELQNRLVVLEEENTALKKQASLMWFLAGAGVLLLGWILGWIMGRRNRRRRSSLL